MTSYNINKYNNYDNLIINYIQLLSLKIDM
jgi:hypothetical protein